MIPKIKKEAQRGRKTAYQGDSNKALLPLKEA